VLKPPPSLFVVMMPYHPDSLRVHFETLGLGPYHQATRTKIPGTAAKKIVMTNPSNTEPELDGLAVEPSTHQPQIPMPVRSSGGWRRYVNRVIGRELSTLTRYMNKSSQWMPRKEDSGLLLAEIDCKVKSSVAAGEPFPDLTREEEKRRFSHGFKLLRMTFIVFFRIKF
jgi:hypothetical protein